MLSPRRIGQYTLSCDFLSDILGVVWKCHLTIPVSLYQIICQFPHQLAHMFFFVVVTVLPAKSDSDIMFCLQSYQGFIIARSLVY